MHGYQLTFFTQQDRSINGVPVSQWLIDEAEGLEIRGATVSAAIQGVGRDGRNHMVNLFDLSEQPLQVTFVVDERQAQALLEHLGRADTPEIFYMRIPVEYGSIGHDQRREGP
ncbi:DUF190 domain-containing protein [Stenotrophomonas maltophilia]|uniref:DUF190 domain-containing protein n=1 Tax=Stenotrophomonas maltophilia TaxID=40324 RepID=UPI002A96F2E1|nr:DUF190 domain-containing protein [Stenotrophomonas maltophilia]